MTAVTVDGEQPAYRDPGLLVDERVESLLEMMTLEEKVAQLGSAWVFQLTEKGQFSREKAGPLLRQGLGHVTRISGASDLTPRDAARLANEIQRYLLEETRLGIPAIVHEEICSGLMAKDAMVYPQAIGVAATWDPDLAREMAAVIRRQMRAMGAHHGLSPVLDVARDPRWGRTEETYGEDPYLVARMGTAFVEGLQGADLTQGVVATAKHFVGYSASEGGLNWAPPHLPDRELREVYLHPFEAVVSAGARSVMNAYHELDGIPCGAHRELLTDILRDEWGFQGTVVSDYFAVRQIASYHHLAEDGTGAAGIALEAGVDVELPGTDCYGEPLIEGLHSGDIDLDVVNISVRRVLRSKFELGLFESSFVDPDAAQTDLRLERGLARRIAEKSMVLLSNDGALPIVPDTGLIAVIGPNADDSRNLFGDYTYPAHIEALAEMQHGDNVFGVPFTGEVSAEGAMKQASTVLDTMRERFGENVAYAKGCDVNTPSREGFDEAVALARRSAIALMVMGDKAGLTTDCTSGEGRDRLSLDLPGVQEDLVRGSGRDRHAHDPGPGLRASRRQRLGARAQRRGGPGLAARRRGSRGPRRCPHGRRQPWREAAHLPPAISGANTGVLRAQGVGRQIALERRLRGRRGRPALSIRPRPWLYDVPDLETLGDTGRGRLEPRGDSHGHRLQHRENGR